MESNRHSLTPRERELCQNIYPAKLATDIGVFLPSTYLIWINELTLGVLVAFIPAIIASLLVIKYGNLEKYATSSLGSYVARYDPRRIIPFNTGFTQTSKPV
jgi:hypothetical protein